MLVLLLKYYVIGTILLFLWCKFGESITDFLDEIILEITMEETEPGLAVFITWPIAALFVTLTRLFDFCQNIILKFKTSPRANRP